MIGAWIIVGLAVSLSQADVDRCLGLEDEQARLACYDRLLGRTRQPAPAAAAATISAPATPAPPIDAAQAPAATGAAEAAGSATAAVAPEASFGLTSSQRPDGKIDAVSGTIVEIEPSSIGRPVLVLDNGQRWRQVDSTTRPTFQAGETVTIRRAAFGSYLATVPDSGRAAVRVRRQD